MAKCGFLMVFAIIGMAIQKSSAIKCWRCSSDASNAAFCDDPFNESLITELQKRWSYVECSFPPEESGQVAVCKKKKILVNDKTVIERTCSWEDPNAPRDSCFNVTTPSSTKLQYCKTCTTDGCNATPDIHHENTTLASAVKVGDALKCWRCSSDASNAAFCDDPFNESNITEQQKRWSYVTCSPPVESGQVAVCKKKKYLINDKTVVERSCFWEDANAPRDSCFNVTGPSYVKTLYCKTCTTDGCNAQPDIHHENINLASALNVGVAPNVGGDRNVGAALKCWRCSSNASNAAFCDDPFNESLITEQQRRWSYVECSVPPAESGQIAVCKKNKFMSFNDKTVIERSCSWEDANAPRDSCFNAITPSYVKTLSCKTCTTDGCNAKPDIQQENSNSASPLNVGNALKCWRCSTDASNAAFCEDPFNESMITEQQKRWSYVTCSSPPEGSGQVAVCKKKKLLINDKTVIERSCSWEDPNAPRDSCFNVTVPSFTKLLSCKTCTTDGCNAKPDIQQENINLDSPLKCWRCSTDATNAAFCNDPFNVTAITEQQLRWSYVECGSPSISTTGKTIIPVCKKMIQLINNTRVISRTCSWEFADAPQDSCISSDQPFYIKTEYCKTCRTHGCNASPDS